MLEEAGHELSFARDGDEGIARLREHPADLVITDIIMPGKDGITTIGELRREFPDVRILARSGGDPRGPVSPLKMAWAHGASDTIQKPFTTDKLLRIVAQLLDPL